MSKRQQSKYKICRRLGVNLWGRPKSPTNRRDYGPGQHGQRRRKPSDFGVQLSAKQRLRGYYGNITETRPSSSAATTTSPATARATPARI